MSENNSTPSGIDIVSLGISVDATQPEQAAAALDKLATATVNAAGKLDKFNDTAADNEKWLNESKRKWLELEKQIESEAKAVIAAEKAQKDFNRAQEAAQAHAQNLIVRIKELVNTFGMSREELLRYQAAQLGVSEAAEPLIQQLERMQRIAQETAIQQRRDIETREMAAKSMREETMEVARSAEAAERLGKAKRDQFNQEARSRAGQIAEYTRWWNEQLDIQEKSLEQQRQNQTAFEAFKKRTMMENRREAMRILEEQEKQALQLAERQALAEISWARMSTRQQIAELEKLRAYKADSRITSETIGETFSDAALRNLPNLDKMKDDFEKANRAAETFKKTTEGTVHAAMMLRSAVTSALAIFGGYELIQMIDGYTKFTAQLKLATNSQQEYAKAYKDIVAISRSAQSDLNATGILYTRIEKATEELGISQLRVAEISEAVALSLRAGGATTMESASAMLQLSQAFAAGRLNGQEFNSVSEAAPRLMKALAEGMGVPVGALKEMATEGKITSEVMAIALPKALADLREEADKVKTISGAFTVFKNSLTEFVGINAEATGLTTLLTDALLGAANNIQLVITGVVSLTAIGLAKWLGLATASVTTLSSGFLAAAVSAKTFFASLGPIGWLITGLGAAATAWTLFGEKAESGMNKAAKVTETTTESIIQDLDRQINKLNERNRLAEEGMGKLAKAEGPEADQMRRLRQQMREAQSGTGQFSGIDEASRMQVLQDLGRQYGTLYAKIEQANAAQTKFNAIGRDKKIGEWMKKYATNNEEMIAELKKAEEELGKVPEDLEKRIRERFAAKNKAPRGSDDRKARMDAQVDAIKDEERIVLASYKAQFDTIEQYNKMGIVSDAAAFEAKMETLRNEEREKVASLKRQLDVINDFNAKTKVEQVKKIAEKRDIEAQISKVELEEKARRDALAASKAADDKKTMDKQLEGVNHTRDLDGLQKLIDRQKAHNDEIKKTKTAVEEAKLASNEATTSMLQDQADAISALLQRNDLNDAARVIYDAELKALSAVISKRRELAGLQEEGRDLQAAEDEQLLFVKQLDQAVESARRFGEIMRETFGDTGKAIGDVVIAMTSYEKKQNQINEAKAKAIEIAGKDQSKIEVANNKAKEASMMNQLQTWGAMASASKGFFKEQSAGYKTMDGLAKIAHVAQVAMLLKEMAMLATKAVMTQAQGDPYTAWARMAAMAAAMAALGFAVGGGFKSNGASGMTAEEMQKKTGTGTVLGDSEAKSESILKSLETIEENSDATMPISQKMLRSLQAIEASMSGLAGMLVRTAGLTSGATLGYQGSVDTKLGGLWGKTKSELVDSGLYIAQLANWASLMQGNNFGQYGTIKTTDSSWFGLKKDTNYDRIFGAIDPKLANQLGSVFRDMSSTMVSASESLGYNPQEVENFIKNIHFPEGSMLSLRGLKGDELKDALNNWFSSIGDRAAELTFANGDLEGFQKVGEGFLETVVRVANGVEKAKVSLDQLGITAIKYREIINQQGDVAAEIVRQSIVEYESRFRQVEYRVGITDQVTRYYTETLSGVGEIMQDASGSAEELIDLYKALVDIQKIMTNVGLRDINEELLRGAGGLENLGNSLWVFQDKFFTDQEKLKMVQDNLARDFTSMGLAVPKTREDFRKLVRVLGADTSEASQKLLGRVLNLAESFDQAMSSSERLAEESKRAAEEAAKAAQQVREAWASVGKTIVDEMRRIRGLVAGNSDRNYAQAQGDFSIAIAQAKAGDQEAAKRIPELSRIMLQLAESQATSQLDLDRIRLTTANTLESLARMFETRYGMDIPGFAAGGTHFGGLRIVGEKGPELEATGPSRIFSSSQTRAILGGELKEELRALRQEVAHFRTENNAAQHAIARNTEKMEKVLTRNDTGNGLLTTDTLE